MIKPPKVRFQPGQVVNHDGTKWKIVYIFRLANQPHEWQYCLEEVEESEIVTRLNMVLFDLNRKDKTPRIVFEPFKSDQDAYDYFRNIPVLGGSRTVLSNQELVQLEKRKQVSTM